MKSVEERERERERAPLQGSNGKVEPTILGALPFDDSTVGNARVRPFAAGIEGETLRSNAAVNRNTFVLPILHAFHVFPRLPNAAVHVHRPSGRHKRRHGHREVRLKPHRGLEREEKRMRELSFGLCALAFLTLNSEIEFQNNSLHSFLFYLSIYKPE